MSDEKILICDSLLEPDTHLVGWSSVAGRLRATMMGLRAFLVAPREDQQVLVAEVPAGIRTMSPEALREWYEGAGRQPRAVRVERGRARLSTASALDPALLALAPEMLQTAWTPRPREVGASPESPENSTEVAGAEAGRKKQASNDIEAPRVPAEPKEKVLWKATKELSVLDAWSQSEGVTWKDGAIWGKGNERGTCLLWTDAGKIEIVKLVDEGGELEPDADSVLMHLDVAQAPEPWQHRIEAIRAARAEAFRSRCVSSRDVRERMRQGAEIEGLIGSDGVVYAPLVTLDAEIQLAIHGNGRVIELESGHRSFFVPVGGTYSLVFAQDGEAPVEQVMQILSDGSIHEPDGVKAPGRVMGHVVISEPVSGPAVGPTVPEEPSEVEDPMDPSGHDAGGMDWEMNEYDSYMASAMEGMDESPVWDDEGFRDAPQEGEMAPIASEVDDAVIGPQVPASSAKGRAQGAAETKGDDVTVRDPYHGAVTVQNWMHVLPRGPLWAAELALAAADSERELGSVGIATQVRLLFKGFRLTKEDKAHLGEALRGVLRSRVEQVLVMTLGGEEFFVRPLSSGYRVIGARGVEVVDRRKLKRLREAYEAKHPVVSRGRGV